jgi:hypothetical protein
MHMRGFGNYQIRLKRRAAHCLVAASAMVVTGTGTVAHAQLGGLFSGKNLEDLIVSQFAKSGAAPDGDRRKRLDDGSLSLTPAEEARANQAASLFSQVPAAGQTQTASMEYQAGTPAGRAQLAQLRNLLKQY